MAAELLTERLQVAIAIALLIGGAAAAWASMNAAKRIGGLVVVTMGAALTLAAIGAPSGLLIAAIAIGFATLAVGCALIVRLQERYETIELAEIDAADEQSEPAESGS